MNIVFIGGPYKEAPCELCGKMAELRPYGPNNEKICFECGMKDEETTGRKFGEILNPGKLKPGQQN